jgi:hypothetical protein
LYSANFPYSVKLILSKYKESLAVLQLWTKKYTWHDFFVGCKNAQRCCHLSTDGCVNGRMKKTSNLEFQVFSIVFRIHDIRFPYQDGFIVTVGRFLTTLPYLI